MQEVQDLKQNWQKHNWEEKNHCGSGLQNGKVIM